MEAKIGYSKVVSNEKALGKKTMEWDLTSWGWDGDSFTAVQLNPLPSDCRRSEITTNNGLASRCDELVLGIDKGKRELEKRRRDEERLNNEEGSGSLILKLGKKLYPIAEDEIEKWEGKSGKKIKFGATSSSSRPICQVENCQADLSKAKDYHRRHKVCDVHSKAKQALVGQVMQRFCQQCSRFHVVAEFDEEKRSCRRRLAGHNRRRRKTHPETVTSSNHEEGSNYLLITLLKILSNIQSNGYEHINNQDILSHLLNNLGNHGGTVNENSLTQLLRESQDLQRNTQALIETPEKGPGINERLGSASGSGLHFSSRVCETGNTLDTTSGREKLNEIDLNNAYVESQDYDDNDLEITNTCVKEGNVSTSGNSASTSGSSGETQVRTDRIVFKLFGKSPNDLPLNIRNQILYWLSLAPTDIESYIKPGCIILTIYLRMNESIWEELCSDLSSSLRRLINLSTDSFWRTGWIYTRVKHRVAFIYNGQVVLNTSLPHNTQTSCKISNIKPIAVSSSEEVKFSVKGFNLTRSTTRLLCALQGKYLVHENCSEITQEAEHNQIQSLSFSSIIPNVTGRGFIEVEDHALSSSFFPFIVAEKDICFEVRSLESTLEGGIESLEAKNQALQFIHEMGWLLNKTHLNIRDNKTRSRFTFERFKWLMEFSIDHEWRAVVKKLLSIIFFNNIIDIGEYSSVEIGLLETCLLHRAVRQNSKLMVEFLLLYHSEHSGNYLFRPDATGPGGLTPLHIAASKDGLDDVLDALTNDPELVGIEAWMNTRDTTGMTPKDYATLRGYKSYINLVQNKINKKSGSEHVVVDIPSNLLSVKSLEIEKIGRRVEQKSCRECEQKLVYRGGSRTSLAMYKPAMLSMVAIAGVCVCVALLFKSSPEVHFVFQPFRWELLKYGTM